MRCTNTDPDPDLKLNVTLDPKALVLVCGVCVYMGVYMCVCACVCTCVCSVVCDIIKMAALSHVSRKKTP